MPYKDLEKQKAAYRRYYQKNKAASKERNRKFHEKVKNWLIEYKKQGCSNCNEKHPACIQFHHKEGNKEYCISKWRHLGYSIDRLQKEISKCQLLCANCHSKLHWSGSFAESIK